MNRLQLATFLFSISISLATVAAGYRWQDADGNTVYSQFPPPPGAQAEPLKLKTPAKPANTAKTAPAASTDNKAAEPQQAGKPEKKTEPDPAELEKLAALKRRNCEAARKNLAIYELPHNRKYIDKDGNYHRIDEDQRQQMIAETRQKIRENCE